MIGTETEALMVGWLTWDAGSGWLGYLYEQGAKGSLGCVTVSRQFNMALRMDIFCEDMIVFAKLAPS